MIKRIEIEVGISSLGDEATQEDMDKWLEYLADRMSQEYPDVEVRVSQHNISNGSRIYVDAEDNDNVIALEEEIFELKNLIWEREEWWK